MEKPDRRPSYDVGRSYLLLERRVAGSWLFMLGGAYAIGMMFAVFAYKAPLARALGVPERTAEGYLLDLILLVFLPLASAFWVHLRRINKGLNEKKREFVAAFEGETLLKYVYNPLEIYVLHDSAPETGEIFVRMVWDADGLVRDATVHKVNEEAFSAFDAEAFLGEAR